MQHKVLLLAIGAFDSTDSHLMTFDIENYQPRLPHFSPIQVHVTHNQIVIHRIVVDEGVSTCVMSLTFYKSIGSH